MGGQQNKEYVGVFALVNGCVCSLYSDFVYSFWQVCGLKKKEEKITFNMFEDIRGARHYYSSFLPFRRQKPQQPHVEVNHNVVLIISLTHLLLS